MKTSRYTEAQTFGILREANGGMPVSGVVRLATGPHCMVIKQK